MVHGKKDIYSGQRWYSMLEEFDGTQNTRAGILSFHLKIEALIWTMEKRMKNLRKLHVTFATDCSQLVKMVLEQ